MAPGRSGGSQTGSGQEFLSVAEMYAADRAAMDAGTPGLELMENAGDAIVREIRRRWPPGIAAVLCGPGNNGGDGFVVARLLSGLGWQVRVGLQGDAGRLKGDAAANARRWREECDGAIAPLGPDLLEGASVVVDALFGAGLARPLEGAARDVIAAHDAMSDRIPLVAVDTPSGVDGDTGEVEGLAPHADVTVTFFRPKPGHLLLPGRLYSGTLAVADIGIPDAVLEGIAPLGAVNGPSLWRVPAPDLLGHKYSRGHALVCGGGTGAGESAGAARLASMAAARIGAGLVTVAAPEGALPLYAAGPASIMVRAADDPSAFATLLQDTRRNAVLIGPGNGPTEATRERVLATLAGSAAAARAVVLDADALTVFAGDPGVLFAAIAKAGPVVLTPHDGEFARLFAETGDRLTRARAGAMASGAVLVLKGGDTVVAAPGGRAVINTNAPADLATAGSGDVLAGMIAGLLAQGMEALEAAAAGVWIHGEAGAIAGPGLIADDLPVALPRVLAALRFA